MCLYHPRAEPGWPSVGSWVDGAVLASRRSRTPRTSPCPFYSIRCIYYLTLLPQIYNESVYTRPGRPRPTRRPLYRVLGGENLFCPAGLCRVPGRWNRSCPAGLSNGFGQPNPPGSVALAKDCANSPGGEIRDLGARAITRRLLGGVDGTTRGKVEIPACGYPTRVRCPVLRAKIQGEPTTVVPDAPTRQRSANPFHANEPYRTAARRAPIRLEASFPPRVAGLSLFRPEPLPERFPSAGRCVCRFAFELGCNAFTGSGENGLTAMVSCTRGRPAVPFAFLPAAQLPDFGV